MTFEEARDKLKRIHTLKTKARDVAADINECKNNIEALTLHSALSGALKIDGGQTDSVVERIVLKIEERQKRLETLLDDVMREEDELAAAIQSLSGLEQDVIIGYYLRDKTHAKLARELHYSIRGIEDIKKRAIKKIKKTL